MEVAESGGWDFLDWLGPDTSACIFHRLDDPTDLARAAAVSRSWRQFGMRRFRSLSCFSCGYLCAAAEFSAWIEFRYSMQLSPMNSARASA